MRFSVTAADISAPIGTPWRCNSSEMQVLHNNIRQSRALRSCPDPICSSRWKRGASAMQLDLRLIALIARVAVFSFFFAFAIVLSGNYIYSLFAESWDLAASLRGHFRNWVAECTRCFAICPSILGLANDIIPIIVFVISDENISVPPRTLLAISNLQKIAITRFLRKN